MPEICCPLFLEASSLLIGHLNVWLSRPRCLGGPVIGRSVLFKVAACIVPGPAVTHLLGWNCPSPAPFEGLHTTVL